MDEAHVQHAVCFVQDKRFEPIKRHHSLLVQIKQSARRRNKNINPIFKTGNLWIDFDPSKHHITTQRQVSAVSTHILKHLRSQLTRRRQHQNSHLPACSATPMS